MATILVGLSLGGCTSNALTPSMLSAASPSSIPTDNQTGCITEPHRCGYPDETNTGVHETDRLTPSGSLVIEQDGQVVDGLDIHGEVSVSAANVTIRNSRIQGGLGTPGPADWVVVVRPGAKNLVIEDSEISTASDTGQDVGCVLNIGNESPTIRRANIHGCSAGVSSGGMLVENSYIHDLKGIPGQSHVVGIASNGGGGVSVLNNTIMNPLNQTAAIALYQDFNTQANNLIQNNLVGGGGYCFYGGDGDRGVTKDIRFTGNRLTRSIWPNCGSFGVIASFSVNNPGNRWDGNFWDEDLSEVP